MREIKLAVNKNYTQVAVSWQGKDKREGFYLPIPEDQRLRILEDLEVKES